MSKTLPKQLQAQADAAEQWDKSNNPQEVTEPAVKVEPTSEAAPEPTVAPAPVVQEPTKPADPQWEHKFKTLQGMYNAHVPALQQQVKELSAKVEELGKAPPVKPAEPDDKPLVTSQDEEAFGKDLLDVARRIAKEEFSRERKEYQKMISTLNDKLEKTSGKVGEVVESNQRNSFDAFLDKLANRLPNWEQIQATDECQTWLDTRVPGTHITWDAALKNAANNQDVGSVVEVFGEFFKQYPQHNPVKPSVEQKSGLESQVSPNKARGGQGPAAPAAKKIYSAQEYSDESMKQLRFTKAGKHKEAEAIERELNAALLEGRVTP